MYKEAPQIKPQEDAHATLRAIYQNPDVPLRMRMNAAIAAIGFERPKLQAIATVHTEGDFGSQLDRCIEMSNSVRQVRLIEASPLGEGSTPTNGHHPTP